MPEYVLVLAGPAPKGADSIGNCFAATVGNRPLCGSINIRKGHIHGIKVPMSSFASALERVLGTVVTDNTGLDGRFYDIQPHSTVGNTAEPLTAPTAPPASTMLPPGDSSFGSRFTAPKEHLGVKLESRKLPIEVPAIDHAEPPSPN